MAKSEFLMLAQEYDPAKNWIAGWFVSEKMDGTRAFWDGGISRGLQCVDVPYANVAKDYRYLQQPIATGLWSRYAKVIHAPDYFLDALPRYICLDGELWMGRGSFQRCRSTVSTLVPGHDWSDVRYHCFDSPSYTQAFAPRAIKNPPNLVKTITKTTLEWVRSRSGGKDWKASMPFESTVPFLQRILKDNLWAESCTQYRLEYMESKAKEAVDTSLSLITASSGEGLILRAPNSLWLPERTHCLLKVKKLQDAEATVTGYTTGRETDKGSKLLGMMGALVTMFNGKRLELSGFTEEERKFGSFADYQWAKENPGVDCPDWIMNNNFPRGSRVTFQYRELSDDGIPKEARYYRRALD